MKPLLVLRKTPVLPWYGHTKRCMGVLILDVDQGVDPPMGVFPNNNVIHRIEIQIFYNNCTCKENLSHFALESRAANSFQGSTKRSASQFFPPHNFSASQFFLPHKMSISILILCPALEAHHIVFISCQQYISVIMSYCIVRPDV